MSRRTAMAALSLVSSDQWGMLTAAQASRVGVSRVDLNRLAGDGTLEAVIGAARVYRVTGAPTDPDLDPVRAAWLQLGGPRMWDERVRDVDAVVSHRSAAHMRGLGDLIPRTYEFYVSRRRRPRRDDLRLIVREPLTDLEWSLSAGLPVCAARRIVEDLLADQEDESAIAQISRDAVRQGMVSRAELVDAVGQYAGAYGHRSPESFEAVLLGPEE